MLQLKYGGDSIKKNIKIVLLAIGLCLVFSKAMFSTYRTETVMSMDGNIYYLQYASYINKNVLEENIKKLSDYIVYQEDGKYYVYLGAFIDLSYAKEMQLIFENQNIYTYIKNDYLSNRELEEKIKEIEYQITNNYKTIEQGNREILQLLKKG